MTNRVGSRRSWLLFFGIAAAVVIVDQVSKLYVDANFGAASFNPDGGGSAPTPIIGDFVRIAKTFNHGGIFGLFGNSAVVLALASLAVIVLIVVYQAREGGNNLLLTVALGLLLGGAMGNIIDRLRLGYVIDFVDMGIGNWRFYTFNVADSAISIALVLLIVLAVFGNRLTRLTHSEQVG